MRVATNTFPDTLINQLSKLTARQNRLQTQAATGQRVALPSDDPAAMSRVLDLQNEASTLEQRKRNITVLRETASVSYNVLNSLKKISDRAGEIAILADDTRSPQELKTYADELGQLIKQGVQLANSKHRGNYLLSGTRSDQPPFVATTDASGQVTAVSFQGNTTAPEAEIAAGATLSAQIIGANTTGSGPRGLLADSRIGSDFFTHLVALQQHLEAGDTASINSSDIPQLKSDEDNFIYHFAQNGVLQSRLDATESMETDRGKSIENLISREADADLAQTLVRLNETQNAYRAALQSGGAVLQQSLMDFLR